MDRMDKLTTLFESDEQLYFCVGLIILVGAIVIICAMVNDYREYLDAHLRTRFRLREFLREEKFYFFSLLRLCSADHLCRGDLYKTCSRMRP